MASLKSLLSVVVVVLLALAFATDVASRPIIEMFPKKNLLGSDEPDTDRLCESWKFSFEANNLRNSTVPLDCVPFVEQYIDNVEIGSRFVVDLLFAADFAYEFAETINLNPDEKNAWIFGVDDTLLSTVPYYQQHGYGSESFNESDFYEWAGKAEAPSNPGGWLLYKSLQNLGFRIIILTGRDEFARGFTEQNLLNAGYSNWDKLIMREAFDQGKDAIVYKSERRVLLELEGYKLHGNTGDQWSDLLGLAWATRSFKFPNPLYYVP